MGLPELESMTNPRSGNVEVFEQGGEACPGVTASLAAAIEGFFEAAARTDYQGVTHTRAEEAFNRRGQTRLVVFDQQRVVGLLLDDLGGDRLLAAHSVDGDDAAL